MGSVGLHTLGNGGVIISDNASAALAGRREISRLVADAVKKHIGAEKFEAMPEAEQELATSTHGANCFRHLPNTWINGGEKAETAWLKESIEDSIAALGLSGEEMSKARLNPGVGGIVRAVAKEFGTGDDAYAKGEGTKLFDPWVEKHKEFKTALVLKIMRAEKGSRFDIATRAAWFLYKNRPIVMEFLKTVPLTDGNILKDYIYVMLGCLENVAAIRARAIINDKFTEPMLFFGASEELDGWSVLNMAPICDFLVDALEVIAAARRRVSLAGLEPVTS